MLSSPNVGMEARLGGDAAAAGLQAKAQSPLLPVACGGPRSTMSWLGMTEAGHGGAVTM